MKATVFIGTSLDGFIARENGDIDWLHAIPDPEDDDYGYGEFMATVDAIVMGRHSYEKVLTFSKWPYGKPVIVLASSPVAIAPELRGKVEHMSGEPRAILDQLASRGITHVYVDGGRTIQRFLEDGLIDRIILTRLPVLIGQGIPLFGALTHDVWLRHVATRAFANGLVQSDYDVVSR